MHIGWTWIRECRQLWGEASKSMLTSYLDQISLSKAFEVHEEELNLQALEEGLKDQFWSVHGVVCISCHGVVSIMSWTQCLPEWGNIPSSSVHLALEVFSFSNVN